MDKLKMQTANKADENFKKLAAMFPNAVTESARRPEQVYRYQEPLDLLKDRLSADKGGVIGVSKVGYVL